MILSIFPAPTQLKDIHLLGREFLQRESLDNSVSFLEVGVSSCGESLPVMSGLSCSGLLDLLESVVLCLSVNTGNSWLLSLQNLFSPFLSVFLPSECWMLSHSP